MHFSEFMHVCKVCGCASVCVHACVYVYLCECIVCVHVFAVLVHVCMAVSAYASVCKSKTLTKTLSSYCPAIKTMPETDHATDALSYMTRA